MVLFNAGSRIRWTISSFALLLFALVFLAPPSVMGATMTRKEALLELGLSPSGKIYSEKEIKKAYRERSLETHPDKGGSDEEFIRVAQAYQTLSTERSANGSSNINDFDKMSEEEAMKMAEDVFFKLFEEMLDDTNSAADAFVDWFFDEIAKDRETGERKKLSFGARQMKKLVRWSARGILGFFKKGLESENVQITINGQTMSGAELKRMRQKRTTAKKKRVSEF